MLSKSWENFMFWIIPYLRKLNKYKGHFFDHILYQDHASFYAYNRPNNKSNNMWKKWSPMLDSSKKNDSSLSFSMFSNLHWFVAFTRFPSTTLLFGVVLCNYNLINKRSTVYCLSAMYKVFPVFTNKGGGEKISKRLVKPKLGNLEVMIIFSVCSFIEETHFASVKNEKIILLKYFFLLY